MVTIIAFGFIVLVSAAVVIIIRGSSSGQATEQLNEDYPRKPQAQSSELNESVKTINSSLEEAQNLYGVNFYNKYNKNTRKNKTEELIMLGKYCSNCGAELDSNAKFCKFCGTRISDERPVMPVDEVKRKVFNWGLFTSNDSALDEVNQWLSGQRLIISDMSTNGRLREFPTNQTIINHLELKYRESANGSYYQMGYFSKWKWIGYNYSALDEMLEKWQAANPDKTVVLKTNNGFQHTSSSGGCRTLFFLYKVNIGY